MFFFRAGFRLSRKYCYMRFDRELLDAPDDLERWGRMRVLGSLRSDGGDSLALVDQAFPRAQPPGR